MTINQTLALLKIIENNQLITIGRELGVDYLTDVEQQILIDSGVDIDQIYKEAEDTLLLSFHFGLLSDALRDINYANKLNFNELYDYINSGEYIPLSQAEKDVLNAVKTHSLGSLRSTGDRIFQDVNQILENSTREAQEKFLLEETEQGLRKKWTTRKIASEIAHKTGDWSRDFDRIIQYTSQSAYERGKATSIERAHGKDALVYKEVYQGACKHCIRLYLTNGLGSEPKIFKLSELITNGSNIGRKVADWLPTLDPLHPYCRCSTRYLSDKKTDASWSIEEKKFIIKPTTTTTRPRPKVRAIVGGKEVWV